MGKESGFALSMSDLLVSCLHFRQRVREKIERDKVERAKKVGNWAETQDSLVEGPVAAEGKDGLSA